MIIWVGVSFVCVCAKQLSSAGSFLRKIGWIRIVCILHARCVGLGLGRVWMNNLTEDLVGSVGLAQHWLECLLRALACPSASAEKEGYDHQEKKE